MPSNLAAYVEDEVEPQVPMPNFAYAHQDHTSGAYCVNGAYEGSSPRTYSVGRELPSESMFPSFEHMNQPPLEPTMAQQEFDASMANPFYDYNPPSKLEELQGHVDSNVKICEVVNALTTRMTKVESEISELRETVVQLGLAALSAPSTPMKPTPAPVKTFEFLNTGLQDQETFETKIVGSNQKKKAAKTHARKDLQVKIPGLKIPTIAPLPSGQPDSGYLTGGMMSMFPSTPTSGGLPSSPLTPGRVGPPTPSKRGNSGNTSIAKRKAHVARGNMAPAFVVVPQVPLTDTELIVYFFQSLGRPTVALRLYSRKWGPAQMVETLNAHRNLEGGYLRNTCSVKCITAINKGKEKYGKNWADHFREGIENANDLIATDLIRYPHDELEGVLDYDIRYLGNGLKKHPEQGVDGGIFTRCVKYCIKHDASYALSNVHELAWALQTGQLTEEEEAA
ncbi:uncharacterized protein J4E84_002308 [Alternaria hordeiaustralica]|uniref:uncharacterized protein n=1 Tax=Alternaria hordeiaustralica TaxID=1187925 RepID=UPI0020C1E7A4|nr:uncharacterized protein J4E84_002308 [Alternaria hordeiaustralica]KAI4693733.1 hypothetical protein J4E84_002308 [Alternaria hordeiaustralica]